MRLDGAVVALTGAGGGIGRELALQLAAKGAALALCDRRADLLTETADRVSSTGAPTTATMTDVTDPVQVGDWAQKTLADHGRIDVLVNNAGLTLPWRGLEDVSLEHLEEIVAVNLWGAVHSARAFLPHLRERPAAAIVNVASLAGLVGFPNQVGYCTSKFALRGFTESLQAELHRSSVCVLLVLPGSIQTDIITRSPGITPEEAAAAIQLQRGPGTTTARRAATRIIAGLERDRRRIVVGKDAAAMALVARALPSAYVGLTARLGELVDKRLSRSR